MDIPGTDEGDPGIVRNVRSAFYAKFWDRPKARA
jgi:hypothetical protein